VPEELKDIPWRVKFGTIFYNTYFMQKANFGKLNMPDKPGVYFFMKGKDILYIGKATSLKDRVKSYFSSDLIETRGPLLVDMVFKSDSIKWTETDSVLEALILEANLIKKNQPYYNTKEKDDKSFNYVCITKDELPKILTVRGKNLRKDDYKEVYGPFVNGGQLREALKIIRKIFPFLDDKSKNYHEFYKQISLAPNLNEKNKYLNNIKNIKLLFEGKKKRIVSDLKKEMLSLAKERRFEEAGDLKRKIFAITHIYDVSLIKEERLIESREDVFRVEAYDIAHMGGKNMVGVMVVLENGEVNKNEYRKFKIRTQKDANDTGALKEVLERRFNHPEWRYPDIIVIDGSTAQINAAEKVLKNLTTQKNSNIKIEIVAVTKDETHKMREIKGDTKVVNKYKREIVLANSEAHRFAIKYHKDMRNKNFLK
jgi:excinuclease ABC subunit C